MEPKILEIEETEILAEAFADQDIETGASEVHTGRPHMPNCV
jgi:hypothetical protein